MVTHGDNLNGAVMGDGGGRHGRRVRRVPCVDTRCFFKVRRVSYMQHMIKFLHLPSVNGPPLHVCRDPTHTVNVKMLSFQFSTRIEMRSIQPLSYVSGAHIPYLLFPLVPFLYSLSPGSAAGGGGLSHGRSSLWRPPRRAVARFSSSMGRRCAWGALPAGGAVWVGCSRWRGRGEASSSTGGVGARAP